MKIINLIAIFLIYFFFGCPKVCNDIHAVLKNANGDFILSSEPIDVFYY